MKVAVTMYSISDCIKSENITVKDFINLMASYKVDAVDLLDYYWKDKEAEIKEIPRVLKDAGVELGAFCTGNNFIVPSEERGQQIDRIKAAIDTAAKLGATKLRVFGGHWVDSNGVWKIPEDVDKVEWMKVIIECFNKCLDYAKDNNVVMAMENHNHLPLTIAECQYIIENVNSPYLGLTFDIGNFKVSGDGEDPVKAAEVLHKHVVHVHAKDAVPSTVPDRKHQFCPLGIGFVPLKETIRVLNQKGYNGCISVEYEGWRFMESKPAIQKSVEYLRKVLSEV